MLNDSPSGQVFQSSPLSRYRQAPATVSMISAAPVLKVSADGRITPTDFFVPSASWIVCDTHLPSK